MSVWIAENYTPFAVGRAFARDRDGREHWVVAVRATFTIAPNGELVVAETQEPVSRVPTYLGDPGRSSLLFESDLPFTRTATDVILIAQAWAPGGRPASTVDVAFQLGGLRKALRVHGERYWRRTIGSAGLTLSRPEPFVNLPIVYERAWGGVDPESEASWPLNPIGRGFARRGDALNGALAPNIEDPRQPLSEPCVAPSAPAGFGALSSNWAQRLRYAGTYDEEWELERAPLWPKDFDARFFQVAPVDQQVEGFLQGGELCELHHLTPGIERLRFALPRVTIHTTTLFTDRTEARVADLHLVLLEPDHRRLQLVWQIALECHGREHTLRRTRIQYQGDKLCLSQSMRTA